MNNITFEEVKNILKHSIDETTNMNDAIERTLQNIYLKGWNDAERNKEQEPCDDAISRQAVLKYIEGCEAELNNRIENILVCRDIKELPPVTPQPKIGHWIFKNDNMAIPTGYYQCSECEEGKLLDKSNFCPNCGTKMEGDINGR